MKILSIIFLIAASLFAKIDINSFESSFIQIVKDDSNKEAKYYGKLYFKKPFKIFWKYEKPIKKYIYIQNQKIVTIEPELEQVTISKRIKIKNIIKILNNAKKVSKNLYEADFEGKKYYIYFDENHKLKKISFKDRFDKNVEILFVNPKQNIDISDAVFQIKIDPSFDIIQD